jgi:transcriptional regulator with XRE-family HTH domain
VSQIPALLRRIRELRGWTQTKLAAKLGVTANTVARWERGEVQPHPLRVPQLERALREAERWAAQRLRPPKALRRIGA